MTRSQRACSTAHVGAHRVPKLQHADARVARKPTRRIGSEERGLHGPQMSYDADVKVAGVRGRTGRRRGPSGLHDGPHFVPMLLPELIDSEALERDQTVRQVKDQAAVLFV